MTKEELLIPRYLCIADFPQWSTFTHKKGEILILKGIHFVGSGTAKSINENEINNYPSVFRQLKWWEYREIKDMPEYIMGRNRGNDVYVKVSEWVFNSYMNCNETTVDGFTYPSQYSKPISQSDYENYDGIDKKVK